MSGLTKAHEMLVDLAAAGKLKGVLGEAFSTTSLESERATRTWERIRGNLVFCQLVSDMENGKLELPPKNHDERAARLASIDRDLAIIGPLLRHLLLEFVNTSVPRDEILRRIRGEFKERRLYQEACEAEQGDGEKP